MKPAIVNLSQLEYDSFGHGDRFAGEHCRVGAKLGAQKLGYTVSRVPAGKRAFPMHNHRANEEMFFILEGEGELRTPAGRQPVKAGDFIACPPGGPGDAHQIINTGKTEMRYLAVSTMIAPEMVDYPDAGTIGVAHRWVGEDGKPQAERFLAKAGQTLDYWEGNQ